MHQGLGIVFDCFLRETGHARRRQALEVAYEKHQKQLEVVCEAENARRECMEKLNAESEVAGLTMEASRSQSHVRSIQQDLQQSKTEAEARAEEGRECLAKLRSQTRELESMRIELSSLQNVSADSAELLSEKLALSRELSGIRPELEHLRAQSSTGQALLADKLALQRELSAVQVELETERRAVQRAMTKENGRQSQNALLEKQLVDLQAEIARERREKQKIERDLQKSLATVEGKNTILVAKVEAFKNKLRLVKEQIKTGQLDQPNAQGAPTGTFDKAVNSKKRTFARLEPDSNIGTPGNTANARTFRRGSSAPGEKSAFSITPFLQRSVNVPLKDPIETSKNLGTHSDDSDESHGIDPLTSPSSLAQGNVQAATNRTARSGKASKPSSEIKEGAAVAVGSRHRGATPSLAQILECPEHQSKDRNQALQVSSTVGAISGADEDAPVQARKRRRLGLGKTLFDEDDADIFKTHGNITAGAAKASKPLPGRARMGGGILGLGASSSAAPTFSPLKRDRRV